MSDHYETRCQLCGGSDEQGCYADCPTATITALRAEVERLRAALVTARGDLYNAANAWNDEDYCGPVPGGEGDFAAHSVASQKKLVDWICSRAGAISAALEEK